MQRKDLAIVMQLTERIKVLIAIKVRAIKREIFILDKNVKSRKCLVAILAFLIGPSRNAY